jgi:hypothetical protein
MTDCILFHLGAQGPGQAMRHYQQRALKPEPPQAIWSRDGRLDAGFGKQQTGMLLFGAAYECGRAGQDGTARKPVHFALQF